MNYTIQHYITQQTGIELYHSHTSNADIESSPVSLTARRACSMSLASAISSCWYLACISRNFSWHFVWCFCRAHGDAKSEKGKRKKWKMKNEQVSFVFVGGINLIGWLIRVSDERERVSPIVDMIGWQVCQGNHRSIRKLAPIPNKISSTAYAILASQNITSHWNTASYITPHVPILYIYRHLPSISKYLDAFAELSV